MKIGVYQTLYTIRNPSVGKKSHTKTSAKEKALTARVDEGKASFEKINTENTCRASRKSSYERAIAGKMCAIELCKITGAIDKLQDNDQMGVLNCLEKYDKWRDEYNRRNDELTKREYDAKTQSKNYS